MTEHVETTDGAAAAASSSDSATIVPMESEYGKIPKLPRIKQEDEDCISSMVAARRGNPDGLKRLIAQGVPPLIANKFGANPFTVAVRFGKLPIIKFLMESALADHGLADLLNQSWHGRRVLLIAIEFGHLDIFNYFMTLAAEKKVNLGEVLNGHDDYARGGGGPQGETLQHYLVTERKIDLIKQLQALGASPNTKDRAGDTVLMRAVKLGHTEEFFTLVEAPDVKVDSIDKHGHTALMFAMERGHEDMALKCIAMGADVNARISSPEDPSASIPYMAARAGMVKALCEMLPTLDAYVQQDFKMRAFEATSKETMPWYEFTTEQMRIDMNACLQEQLFAASRMAASGSPGKNKVRWQYKEEDGSWKDMTLKDTKAIDLGAKNNPGAPIRLKASNGKTYLIDTQALKQTNMQSSKKTAIRRNVTQVLTAADIAGSPGTPRSNVQRF